MTNNSNNNLPMKINNTTSFFNSNLNQFANFNNLNKFLPNPHANS